MFMGLPARMVSLSDTTDGNDYQHMFAEVYGYNINGNNGWFLIDPARDVYGGRVLSSYNDTSYVKSSYAARDGKVERLWIIWGIEAGHWGEGIEGHDRQTSWVYAGNAQADERAPNEKIYEPNPWDIDVIYAPHV